MIRGKRVYIQVSIFVLICSVMNIHRQEGEQGDQSLRPEERKAEGGYKASESLCFNGLLGRFPRIAAQYWISQQLQKRNPCCKGIITGLQTKHDSCQPFIRSPKIVSSREAKLSP